MLAHFFMIRDEVNCRVVFWFGFFLGGGGSSGGFFVCLLCFVLFICCCCCTWTQFVRGDFIRARILHAVHIEIEHQG